MQAKHIARYNVLHSRFIDLSSPTAPQPPENTGFWNLIHAKHLWFSYAILFLRSIANYDKWQILFDDRLEYHRGAKSYIYRVTQIKELNIKSS